MQYTRGNCGFVDTAVVPDRNSLRKWLSTSLRKQLSTSLRKQLSTSLRKRLSTLWPNR